MAASVKANRENKNWKYAQYMGYRGCAVIHVEEGPRKHELVRLAAEIDAEASPWTLILG